MADDLLPETFQEAIKLPGARVPSEAELRDFLGSLPPGVLAKRLVDCTLPENEGRRCFVTGCYQGRRAVQFCQNGRCQLTVFYDC
ncbi:hypothetical protein [Ensifer adhaerens]|uniref:hypothetical protein n=1 Tax=Ensifer adhaerens TaxID=106592 RepID=UPI003F85A0BD